MDGQEEMILQLVENLKNRDKSERRQKPQEHAESQSFSCNLSLNKQRFNSGDTLYVRGVILNTFTNKPAQREQFSEMVFIYANITDSTGKKVFKSKLSSARESVLSFSWKVPKNSPGGEYVVEVYSTPLSSEIIPILSGLQSGDLSNDSDDLEEIIQIIKIVGFFPPTRRKFDVVNFQAPKFKKQLEFEKNAYGQGENVKATLEVFRSEGGVPQNANVEVIARVDAAEVFKKKYPLDPRTGKLAIEFELPENIQKGVGNLTCVVTEGISESISKTIPIVLKMVICNLYPEGGVLVSGVTNGVYFESKTVYGEPSDIKATILEKNKNGEEKEVQEIWTYHEGRGSFEFLCRDEHTYSLRVNEPKGITVPIHFPKPREKGISLRCVNKESIDYAEKKIDVILCSNYDMEEVEVELFKKWHRVGAIKKLKLSAGEEKTVSLEYGEYHGVLRVVVNEKGNEFPKCERVVFVNPPEEIMFDVECKTTRNGSVFAPGDHVEVCVSQKVEEKQKKSVVCCTVVDDSVIQMVPRRQHHPMLLAGHYLENDVRGELFDSEFFFKSTTPGMNLNGKEINPNVATDLLLGCEDSRRFLFAKYKKDGIKILDSLNDENEKSECLRILCIEDMDRKDELMDVVANLLEFYVKAHIQKSKAKKMRQEISQIETEIRKLKEERDPLRKPVYEEVTDDEDSDEEDRENAEEIKTGLAVLEKKLSKLKESATMMGDEISMEEMILEDLSSAKKFQSAPSRKKVEYKEFEPEEHIQRSLQAIDTIEEKSMSTLQSLADQRERIERAVSETKEIEEDIIVSNRKVQEKSIKGEETKSQSIEDIKRQIDDVKEVMSKNIEQVLQRGDKLDDLLGSADELLDSSKTFSRMVEDADADTVELAKDVLQTAAEMKSMQSLVNEQNEMLDTIEGNIMSASEQVMMGRSQLEMAAPPRLNSVKYDVVSKPSEKNEDEKRKVKYDRLNHDEWMYIISDSSSSSVESKREKVKKKTKLVKRELTTDEIRERKSREEEISKIIAEKEDNISSLREKIEEADRVESEMEHEGRRYNDLLESNVGYQYSYEHRNHNKEANRTDFTDTVYYSPFKKLENTQKQFNFGFDLSDSITSYRVFVDGFDEEGNIGSSKSYVFSVSKRFFIDVKMPLQLTSSDTAQIPVSFVNNSKKNAQCVLQVDQTQKGLKIGGDFGETTMVDAGKRIVRYVSISPISPCSTKLKIKGSVLSPFVASDTVESLLKIVPHGYPKSYQWSGLLKSGETREHKFNIPGDLVQRSLHAISSVTPSCLSTLLSTFSSMIKRPYGCFEQTTSTMFPLIMAKRFIDASNAVINPSKANEIEEFISTGYSKLRGFQVGNEGFSLFGNHPASIFLTSLGLRQFGQLQKIWPVDKIVVQQASDWLLSMVSKDRYVEKCSIEFLVYTLWSISSVEFVEMRNLEKIVEAVSIRMEDVVDCCYAISLWSLCMWNLGKHDESEKYAQKLLKYQLKDGSFTKTKNTVFVAGGKSKILETTALSALCFFNFSDKFIDHALKAIEFILSNRTKNGFGNTQSSCLCMEALVKYFELSKDVDVYDVEVKLSENILLELAEDENCALVTDDFAEKIMLGKENSIRVTNLKASPIPYSISIDMRVEKEDARADCPFDFICCIAKDKLKQGEVVEVQVKLVNKMDKELPMTVACVSIPAGLEVRLDKLKELKKQGIFSYFEMIDRNVVFYWENVKPSAAVDFMFEVSARIPGDFVSDYSRAYLYYDEERNLYTNSISVKILP